MKKIKNLIIMLVLICLSTACSRTSYADINIIERLQDNKTIRWGVKVDTNLFGLYNIKTGQIEGFDVDIAKAITEVITGDANNAEFIEVTSKTRIPLIKNGNIDAIIATMSITEERKKQVHFTDVYFDAGQALLVPEDSHINSVKDLDENTTVLAVKGSTSALNIREHAPTANILELENYAEAFTALQSNQGHAMTTDNAILMGIVAQNPGYRVTKETFTTEPYGIAINHGQEDFLQVVNEALREIKQNGTYDEIYDKWFGGF